MLKFTLKTMTFLLFFIAIVDGANELPTEEIQDAQLKKATDLIELGHLKEAKIFYIKISQNNKLPWVTRLLALEKLSEINPMAAVQAYHQLLQTVNLQYSTKLKIKVQLTRLTPDLEEYWEIIDDPNFKPFEHLSAAYHLQDWVSPKEAVNAFELLLTRIEHLCPLPRVYEEDYSCPLDKIRNAAKVIISELNSNFIH